MNLFGLKHSRFCRRNCCFKLVNNFIPTRRYRLNARLAIPPVLLHHPASPSQVRATANGHCTVHHRSLRKTNPSTSTDWRAQTTLILGKCTPPARSCFSKSKIIKLERVPAARRRSQLPDSDRLLRSLTTPGRAIQVLLVRAIALSSPASLAYARRQRRTSLSNAITESYISRKTRTATAACCLSHHPTKSATRLLKAARIQTKKHAAGPARRAL